MSRYSHFAKSTMAALALLFFVAAPTVADDHEDDSESSQRDDRDRDSRSQDEDRQARQSDRDRDNWSQRNQRDNLDLEKDDAAIGVTVRSDSRDGAVIRFVHPNSPAADAGLRSGDRITHVDDEKVRDARRAIWFKLSIKWSLAKMLR